MLYQLSYSEFFWLVWGRPPNPPLISGFLNLFVFWHVFVLLNVLIPLIFFSSEVRGFGGLPQPQPPAIFRPGIEPGAAAWKAAMLPLHHRNKKRSTPSGA